MWFTEKLKDFVNRVLSREFIVFAVGTFMAYDKILESNYWLWLAGIFISSRTVLKAGGFEKLLGKNDNK